MRCSQQDILTKVTAACSVNFSSSFQNGISVGSASFLLRSIPTGFYQISFSYLQSSNANPLSQNLFQSNVFQLFIHNPVPRFPEPQLLSGLDLKNAQETCQEYLYRIFLKLDIDGFLAFLLAFSFRANHVFRGNMTQTTCRSRFS